MSDISSPRYDALRGRFPNLPETPVIVRAFEHVRQLMPAVLFNHVVRSWVFAVQVAERSGLAYDAEVLAVATLFHDLGLTPHGEGPHRFEVNGANLAMSFAREQGFDDRRAQLVWDGVALHATPSIGVFKEAEVSLCARGIGVDFGAPDHASFPPAEIDAIVEALPRLDMKQAFKTCACHLARTAPEANYDNFVRDFGERFVQGYAATSWVERIMEGPFAE